MYRYVKAKPLSWQIKKAFNTLGSVFIIAGVLFLLLAYAPLIRDEFWYFWKEVRSQKYELNAPGGQEDSVFARFLTSSPVSLKPVNTDFGLVIEKIGVNVPIVVNVTVTNQDSYFTALKDGVAHAAASEFPSRSSGNVYIFAHSSLNFWELGKYATVFNLLRKLEIGDRVHVFYEGSDYIYSVANKEILKGWNTYPLTRPTIEPLLTLQTCHPPGTTLNRLVVTAKLVDVVE